MRPVFHVALVAATILLAGCGGPSPALMTIKPVGKLAAAATKQTPTVQATVTKTAAVISSQGAEAGLPDDDMLGLDEAVADASEGGSYSLQALGGGGHPLAKALVKAKVVKAVVKAKVRKAILRGKIVKAAKGVAAKIKAMPWVDNGDGTQTKAGTLQGSFLGATGSCTFSITVDKATHRVTTAHEEVSGTRKDGTTFSATRDKVADDAGGYAVTMSSTATRKDGKTASGDMNESINADGNLDGTLDRTNFKGEQKSYTISGTVEHPVVRAANGDLAPADAAADAIPADDALDAADANG